MDNPLLQKINLRNAIEDMRYASALAHEETPEGKCFAKHVKEFDAALLQAKAIIAAWISPPSIPDELLKKYYAITNPKAPPEETP